MGFVGLIMIILFPTCDHIVMCNVLYFDGLCVGHRHGKLELSILAYSRN